MKLHRLIPVVLVSILLLGCSKPVDSNLMEREAIAYSEKSFEVENAPQLKLIGDNCKFEFYSWTKKIVKFETDFHVRGKAELQTLEEWSKKKRPDIRQDGRVLTCQARFKSPKSGIKCSSEIRVFLPKTVKAIQFDVNDGSLTFMDDLSCQLNGKGTEVSLSLKTFKGRVNFNSSQGNASIEGGRIEGGSTIYTGKGNVDVKAFFEGSDSCSFETALGNIHLDIASKSRVRVEAQGKVEENCAKDWDYPVKISLISQLGRIWVSEYSE